MVRVQAGFFLSRFFLTALSAIALSTGAAAAAADRETLDASPTLFTVMAAMNAAGFPVDLDAPGNHPLRTQVLREVLSANPASLVPLRAFFEKHRKTKGAEELSQYVSFALSVHGPPDFRFGGRDVDTPPDAVALRELIPLLAKFYKEADIEGLWKRSQPSVDQYLQRYQAPVADTLLQVNAYLRQLPSGIKGRSFQVQVSLLGPPGQVQTRSYGDDYTIVATPSAQPRVFEIRHAYLHYLLDPLSTRERDILGR